MNFNNCSPSVGADGNSVDSLCEVSTRLSLDDQHSRESSGVFSANDDEGDSPGSTESRIQKLRKVRQGNQQIDFRSLDRSSPLYSSSSFEDLKIPREFLDAVYMMGFRNPSKIQEKALRYLMSDPPMNMIAQSQSGTGKTITFLLASLSRIDKTLKHPQVLILSPTFELAKQTASVAERVLRFTREIGVQYAVRGQVLPSGSRIRKQIVIGTPGKLIDWALKYRFFDILKIKVFVFDEADIMISEVGHRDQSIRLHSRVPVGCQTMLFSATYDEDVKEFASNIIPDPCVKIELKRGEEFMENVVQYVMYCPGEDTKQRALENIYCSLSVGQALIFCHTKASASKIAAIMKGLEMNVAVLTGDHTPAERASTIESFRQGLQRVLITTNLCARGIDIEQVSLVVNFDLPVDRDGSPDYETYLHRIGRTGRFGRAGVAIDFVNPYCDNDLANAKKIRDHFKRDVRAVNFKDFDRL